MRGNWLLLKDLLELYKHMKAVGKNVYFNVYNDIVQKTIKKHQDLCGIITETNQTVVHKTVLIIQSKIQILLTIKQV